ncbi:hypothetical protein C8F01DRAFT_928450, partial [Mycena amicta]
EDALHTLWGPILHSSRTTLVYVEGAGQKGETNAVGGAGVFFGTASPLNCAIPVPSGGRRITGDRARLCAIIECLRRVHADTTLAIFCSSKFVIRCLCYDAAEKAQIGWPGVDGDLYKVATHLLASRHAETRFIYVDVKDNN